MVQGRINDRLGLYQGVCVVEWGDRFSYSGNMGGRSTAAATDNILRSRCWRILQ